MKKIIVRSYIWIRDYLLYKKRCSYIPVLRKYLGDDVSIISTNCFAGHIYQDLKLGYKSPTAGLYFVYPDYIEFLKNLSFYLKADLLFVNRSKYPVWEEFCIRQKKRHPIALLGGKVEVHFLHYSTNDEAKEKWKRRAGRVNFDNLFIIGMDQNLCNVEDIKTFESLPYKNKVMFSSKEIEGDYIIYMKEFAKDGQVGNPHLQGHIFYRYLVNYLKNRK